MEGLYDAATLHAPCQVYPFPCTLTGSFLNDHKVIVHDRGELQMHLLRQSEYGQAGIPECPGLLTPSRHKRCVQMAIRMQMWGDPFWGKITRLLTHPHFPYNRVWCRHGPRSSANAFRLAGQHNMFAPRMRLHAREHKMLPISIGLVA
jgi:hypothetical protein